MKEDNEFLKETEPNKVKKELMKAIKEQLQRLQLQNETPVSKTSYNDILRNRGYKRPDISKDFQRDKEYFSLDYSDMQYRLVKIPSDEF